MLLPVQQKMIRCQVEHRLGPHTLHPGERGKLLIERLAERHADDRIRCIRQLHEVLDPAGHGDDVVDACRRKQRTQDHEQKQDQIHRFLAC